MGLTNTANKFGSLTKILHWSIFLLFVVQYYLVYRREYFPKGSQEKLQYMLLHKSIGVCLLFLALAMIIWHHVGTRPMMPMNMSKFDIFVAKTVHFLLYVSMLVMPLSGIAMSMYGGRAIDFFGWFTIPLIVAKNETLSHNIFNVHVWSSYVVIGLVSLHVLAALYHHFVKKDAVLKRML